MITFSQDMLIILHPFCNLQSRARTHAVLVIGLYELIGNPTTYLIEPLVKETSYNTEQRHTGDKVDVTYHHGP
jgi:hypothetical protein